jgi:carboxymethylenebutenolidase
MLAQADDQTVKTRILGEKPMPQRRPPQPIIELFDRYTHGGMSRRAFLDRLATMAGGTAAATALLPVLENNYARAETIAADDPRLATRDVRVPHASGTVACYEAAPRAGARLGTVLVVHENRGLNPHIKDVARRLAVEGFLAVAVDLLSVSGGTPDDVDRAMAMIRDLRREDALAELRGVGDAYLRDQRANGKLGVVGFCWGGSLVNAFAVAEERLSAGVAYYGAQPPADQVPRIHAALLLHYAGLDQQTNAGIPAYEAALRAAGKRFEIFVYAGANHGFNNDTNEARYDRAAAEQAWTRTVAFLRANLAATG